MSKVTSIYELAKWKAGDTAYWVTYRNSNTEFTITNSNRWMFEAINDRRVHPHILYNRDVLKWPKKIGLVALPAIDFQMTTGIIWSELAAEPFVITSVVRSDESGEFMYKNTYDEWMPESLLFSTPDDADAERTRILDLFKQWVAKQEA